MSANISNKKNSNGKKYIICDSAKAKWGKTETLLRVISLLIKSYPLISQKQNKGRDKWCHFQLPNFDVVVSTLGDPYSAQPIWIDDAAKTGARFIATACRTSGATVNVVKNVAMKYGYEIIWFQNFHFDNISFLNTPEINSVRDLDAQHIVDMFFSL